MAFFGCALHVHNEYADIVPKRMAKGTEYCLGNIRALHAAAIKDSPAVAVPSHFISKPEFSNQCTGYDARASDENEFCWPGPGSRFQIMVPKLNDQLSRLFRKIFGETVKLLNSGSNLDNVRRFRIGHLNFHALKK
jgi:hypothetical protein